MRKLCGSGYYKTLLKDCQILQDCTKGEHDTPYFCQHIPIDTSLEGYHKPRRRDYYEQETETCVEYNSSCYQECSAVLIQPQNNTPTPLACNGQGNNSRMWDCRCISASCWDSASGESPDIGYRPQSPAICVDDSNKESGPTIMACSSFRGDAQPNRHDSTIRGAIDHGSASSPYHCPLYTQSSDGRKNGNEASSRTGTDVRRRVLAGVNNYFPARPGEFDNYEAKRIRIQGHPPAPISWFVHTQVPSLYHDAGIFCCVRYVGFFP